MICQGLETSSQQCWQTNNYYIHQSGRNIDLFTQKGGRGYCVPSEPFHPQETVILYANATYNGYPIQNKAVILGVYDPHDYMISLLYGVTNESGIATSSFRPPWLPDEPEKYLGIWKVMATVEIADTVLQDTVEFELGFSDVAINNVAFSKTIVGKAYALPINVTIENQGKFIETFYVTVYANTTEIETRKIDNMINGTSVVLAFTWQTLDFDKGYYTISAYATPVAFETDTGDNNFTHSQVKVVTPGNVNGDEIVNMQDIYMLILQFLHEAGDNCHSANCDINSDGFINMQDIYIAIMHFMQTDP
jgi:hypothetical protein